MPKTKEDYKRMLDKIKSNESNSKFDYHDLEDGDTVVRVLPGHPNMEGFFVEVWQHGKKVDGKYMNVPCINKGDPRATDCLIDSEDLEALRVSKDKADKDLYKEYKSKPRYYLNVVVRKLDNAVKTLPAGSQILKGILTYITDDEYGDILDATEGRDLIINKTGKGMDTEYTVKPKVKTSPIFSDEDDVTKLIGTNAEDSQIPDLSELTRQFEDEGDKALLVWRKGWQALKDLEEKEKPATDKPKAGTKKSEPQSEEDEEVVKVPLKSRCSVCGEKRFKTASGNVCDNGHVGVPLLAEGAQPSAPSKAYLKEFPPAEPEPEAPKAMKSRCAVCGDKRFKYADGKITCLAGHGGPQLADDARPTKPSKEFLAEFPDPAAEEEEEEAEAVPTKPAAGGKTQTNGSGSAAGKTTAKPALESPSEDEEGLDDLDAILAQHTKGKGK